MFHALRLPDLDARPAPPPPPPPLEDPVEVARREARAEALREGEARGRAAEVAGREAMAEETLRVALLAMDDLREEARAAAEAGVRDLARMVLAMVDAALPGTAAARAPDMIPALFEALGPVADAPAGAALRVPPAILDVARDRFGDRGLPIEPDPALPEGDARLEWRHGGIRLSLASRRAAIREALATLDLIHPAPDPSEGPHA